MHPADTLATIVWMKQGESYVVWCWFQPHTELKCDQICNFNPVSWLTAWFVYGGPNYAHGYPCTVWMHSAHDIILQAGIVYLSFKTTVDDIEWSYCRRVDLQGWPVKVGRLLLYWKGIPQWWFSLNRMERVCNETTTYDGMIIEEGVHVFVSIWTIHYDEEIWTNPTKFDPER